MDNTNLSETDPISTFYVYCSNPECEKYHGKLKKRSQEFVDLTKLVEVPEDIKARVTAEDNYVPSLCVECGGRLFITTILSLSLVAQMKRMGVTP